MEQENEGKRVAFAPIEYMIFEAMIAGSPLPKQRQSGKRASCSSDLSVVIEKAPVPRPVDADAICRFVTMWNPRVTYNEVREFLSQLAAAGHIRNLNAGLENVRALYQLEPSVFRHFLGACLTRHSYAASAPVDHVGVSPSIAVRRLVAAAVRTVPGRPRSMGRKANQRRKAQKGTRKTVEQKDRTFRRKLQMIYKLCTAKKKKGRKFRK